MARMAALISSIRGISTVGVHILSTGDGLIRVAFEPSGASLCVPTSRPQCFSSGCLSTRLEPVEEFHPPTSGAASNSSESEK